MNILFIILPFLLNLETVRIPIKSDQIELTEIGAYGLIRKARPNVPEHLHTGIDIKRPGDNYVDEPIFPIASGIVISKRTDGPYAQLIIEHQLNGITFWTNYEHIAEISVELDEIVYPDTQIAQFFSKELLDKHGWQFDHFHFEILKTKPMKIIPSTSTPDRHFMSHTLRCYTRDDLHVNFYHPLVFLDSYIH